MGIVLKNIVKTYDSKKNILNGISLEIKRGQLMAIQGKSGAGKSTLLHIIGCLDTRTRGEYILDEIDVSEYNKNKIARLRNRKFGFVMQDFGLINEDTVYANVALPLFLGDTRMKFIAEMVEKQLESLGILNLKGRRVESLSGGEKQRVAIARALINNPEYILADEPTGALDTTNTDLIMKILCELNKQGKTVVIVTHDREIAIQCNEVIQIVDGIIDLT